MLSFQVLLDGQMTFLLFFLLLTPSFLNEAQSVLDNGFVGKLLLVEFVVDLSLGDPKVECMEDRLKLTFKTEKPFKGRIFVKGMIDDKNCVSSYAKNSNSTVDYSIINGSCNMRRNRKVRVNRVLNWVIVLSLVKVETGT